MLIRSILYMTITNAIDSTAVAAVGGIVIYQLRRLFRMVCSACFKFFSDIEPVRQMHSRNGMERVPYARFCTGELLYLLYSFFRKDATGKQQRRD